MNETTEGTGSIAERALIAVVDDDPAVRKGLTRLLRATGFAASSFSSGEELLVALERSHVDCLLLDVRMRGMSGIDVCKHLARGRCRVPVVLMSAHVDEESRADAAHSGAIAFLQKPISEEALCAAIQAAIGTGDSQH